jgi:two-component system response regulator HydG
LEALNMGRLTLKHALLLTVAILVIVTGLIISQTVTHHYGASLIEGVIAQAENTARKLALDSADRILTHDLVALQRLIDDQMATNPAIAYIFVMRDGQVLSHTFQEGVPYQLISANGATDADRGHVEKIISQTNERFIDLAWPIFEGKAGTLRIGFSESPYRQKITRLWMEMSIVTVGILALMLVAGHLFVNRLTRPLVKLASTVERIGEDNLTEPIVIKGRTEVSRLAASFNRMLARLREYTERLEATNERLEGKNQELDRAQRQLRTSLAIAREMAALPDLKAVSGSLIRVLKSIVECRQMALLIVNSVRGDAFAATDKQCLALGSEASKGAIAAISGLQGTQTIDKRAIEAIPLPFEMQSLKHVCALPVRHENELLGAMLIGCPNECACVRKEIEIIELIIEQTSGAIRRAILHEDEIRDLRARIEPSAEFSGMVGKDPRMQLIYKLIEDVSRTDATVLIQGESGTGKELVARAIHVNSPRRDRPFIVINCAAYPSTLLESELFGHEKGAFTGASRRRAGRFEQADGGTVFLDEIGEIPQSAQIKLLRVLQSQRFERVGGEQTLNVDVRLLAATNKNLLEQVRNGQFREDLFYRLNVIPIQVPPLRGRTNDIPVLARHFLRVFAARQKKEVREFSTEAMRALLGYSWPGNVRELENTIEHAVVLAKGNIIEALDLPGTIMGGAPEPTNKTIMDNEARLLREVLIECNWNKTEAAVRLGISRSTLYEKIKKYQLSPPTVH